MTTGKKLISIVSPAFNEEKNLPLMYKEITRVFSESLSKYDFEYIIVDDGSRDNTWNVIKQLATEHRNVKGYKLSRNFGHQLALTAGLDMAHGDCVIFCDSDLQHPPEVFVELIKMWESGYDVVNTIRESTEDISNSKNFMSNAFYSVINMFSDVRIEKGMADFKLLDGKVLKYLVQFREVNRFLRGIIPWLGFKSCSVHYVAHKRQFGKPGFSLGKSMFLAKTGILSFSIKPLKFIGYFGVLLTIIAALIASFSVAWYILFNEWYFSPLVTLMVINALLIGLVLICLGIMSLYLSYIYNEVVRRPLYIVEDQVNL